MIIVPYEDSKFFVRIENWNAHFFKLISGVKQECVLFPLLFVVVMEYILRQCPGPGVRICSRQNASECWRLNLQPAEYVLSFN